MPGSSSVAVDQLVGMLNIFVDPAATVKRIPRSYSWLWPLLIVSVVMAAISLGLVPVTLRVMQENPPGGLSAEQLQRALPMIETSQKVLAWATPVVFGVLLAFQAAILLVSCVLTGIRARYRDLFSLLAHGALIGVLQSVAGYAVVRLKGDQIQTLEELQPGFGLDLLIGASISKPLMAALKYFSVFTIWYIIILGIALAALAGVTKKKAYLASAPVWLLSMLLAVALSFVRR